MNNQELIVVLEGMIADSKRALPILCEQPFSHSQKLARDLRLLEVRVVEYCKAHRAINPNDVGGDAQPDGIVKRDHDDPDMFISPDPTPTQPLHGFICPFGKCEISIKPK